MWEDREKLKKLAKEKASRLCFSEKFKKASVGSRSEFILLIFVALAINLPIFPAIYAFWLITWGEVVGVILVLCAFYRLRSSVVNQIYLKKLKKDS